MKRFLVVSFLAVVVPLVAPSAQAYCLKCYWGDCFQTSVYPGVNQCFGIPSGGGCLTAGHCAPGTPGCPDPCRDPEQPTAALKSCPVTRLASVWKLESVVVRQRAEVTFVR